jgi:hypothetical protein
MWDVFFLLTGSFEMCENVRASDMSDIWSEYRVLWVTYIWLVPNFSVRVIQNVWVGTRLTMKLYLHGTRATAAYTSTDRHV